MAADVPALRIDGLAVRRGAFALGPLSLTLADGEYLAILGHNGSGKSMLLKAIAGIVAPDAGAVAVAGRDLADVPAWRRPVALMPQDALLFPHLGVRANLLFGLAGQGEARAAAARRLDELAGRLGVAHLLARAVHGLSGGERQLLCLVRTLLRLPALLLLDEPTSALQAERRHQALALLRGLHRSAGLTVVHVSHQPAEMDGLATRTLALDQGQWIQAESPSLS